MLFEEIDADGDGAVTQAEIDAFRAAKVAGADTSGDGALSIEEFDTLYREFTRWRMVRAFQELDTDGDGVISQAEMDRRFGRVVEQMDRDGDGALTLQDRRPRD
jgi:Ca2+-binding EF-hand superfamily protein